MSLTVRFEGGRELERKLRELGKPGRITAAVKGALEEAAEPIRASAEHLAPDDPATAGDLKPSITMKTNRRGDIVTTRIGINSSQDPPSIEPRKRRAGSYRDPGVAGNAVIQEFGTENMDANPFMRPAWDAEGGKAPERIGQRLGPEIEKLAARSR